MRRNLRSLEAPSVIKIYVKRIFVKGMILSSKRPPPGCGARADLMKA